MLYTLGCFAFLTLSFAFHPITVPNQALGTGHKVPGGGGGGLEKFIFTKASFV